jgi:hypothetical protein
MKVVEMVFEETGVVQIENQHRDIRQPTGRNCGSINGPMLSSISKVGGMILWTLDQGVESDLSRYQAPTLSQDKLGLNASPGE